MILCLTNYFSVQGIQSRYSRIFETGSVGSTIYAVKSGSNNSRLAIGYERESSLDNQGLI